MNKFVTKAISAASALILSSASVAASAPCVVVFYQPKSPQNMKARLETIKNDV